ncbi:MAG: tetratricopeptide repeat protein [Candidatus Thiodiazotropha sp.]
MHRLWLPITTLLFTLFMVNHALAQESTEDLIAQAVAASEKGELKQARSLLLEAVAQSPDSSLAYTRLGGVQLLQQEYGPGIESFQQAIMLDKGNADAFIGLSLAYLHQGRHALAREALKEASKLGTAKQQEIDKVLVWLDQRDTEMTH